MLVFVIVVVVFGERIAAVFREKAIRHGSSGKRPSREENVGITEATAYAEEKRKQKWREKSEPNPIRKAKRESMLVTFERRRES